MKLLSQETLIFVINRLLANLQKLVQLPSLRLRHAKASGQIPISIKRFLAWKTLIKLSPGRQPRVLILIEGTRDSKVQALNASLKALVETKYKNLAIAFYQPKTSARGLQELTLFRLEENYTLSPVDDDNRSFGFISRICPGDLFTKDAFHLALVKSSDAYKQKELLLFGNQVIRYSNGTATGIALPTYGKVSQLFSHFIDQGFLMSWPLAIKYSDNSALTLNESLDLSLLEGLNANSNLHAAHLNRAIFVKDASNVQEEKPSQEFVNAISSRLDKRLNLKMVGDGKLKIDLAKGYFPTVHIIIPTRDALHLIKACVESIINMSSYKNYRVTIVDNGSVMSETLFYFDKIRSLGVEVIEANVPFNFSYLNNIVGLGSESEYLCLLNNDVVVSSPDWLESMIALSVFEANAIVGSKLLYPDGRVQHMGVQVKQNGSAGHPYHGMSQNDSRIPKYALENGEVDAVTAACMLVPTQIYKKLGGLDEKFHVGLNDIDFCLRALEIGVKSIQNNDVVLVHHESASRGKKISLKKFFGYAKEVALFNSRHRKGFMKTRPGLTLLNPGGEVDLAKHATLSGALK